MKLDRPTLQRFAAAAVALAAWSNSHADTASANMVNTVTVTGSCSITSSGFNTTYDPVSANVTAPKDVTGSVSTICTLGTAATIRLGQGLYPGAGSTDALPVRRLSNGLPAPTFINYTLSQDSARTLTWGNTLLTGVPVAGTGASTATTVYARIAPGQTGAGPGVYSDTVVATVEF